MINVNTMKQCCIKDNEFTCAVVAASFKGKWVFVKRKGKAAWELIEGIHETGEKIFDTASREIRKETGAKVFSLIPICAFLVDDDGTESIGELYYSEIQKLGGSNENGIEAVHMSDFMPDDLIYPEVHSVLFRKAKEFCRNKE